MKKYFNTSGPCWPDKHYMLPTTERCEGLLPLIARQQYFIIHAARQTGKTTLLMDLMQQLNQSGDYYALYCSLEVADKIVDPKEGIPAIVKRLRTQWTGRLDLCVLYGDHRYLLELKVRHQEKTYEAGKAQLACYMETMGCVEGWLIVFDKRKTVPWEEKLFWQTAEVEGKTIHTVGC